VAFLTAMQKDQLKRVEKELFAPPNPQTVKAKADEFNSKNKAIEHVITSMIREFPRHDDLETILCKVKVVNTLYNTNIIAVRKLAKHIMEQAPDKAMAQGDEGIINKIAVRDAGRNNYSFATKYCSWHQPSIFRMYDSRVEICLRKYSEQPGFPDERITYASLRDYVIFSSKMNIFQDMYGLKAISFKDVDKFLYGLGDEYFARYDEIAAGSSTAPSDETGRLRSE
jgi:hypothetical protein